MSAAVRSRALALVLATLLALSLLPAVTASAQGHEEPGDSSEAVGASGAQESLAAQGEDLVSRLAGPTRIETAVEVSRAVYDSADTVLIARSDQYPDALTSAPLAAALEAPLLLTSPAGIHDAVAAEVERLGATSVVLLGGEAALSRQVETDLQEVGVDDLTRLAGENRFDTARLVAEQLITEGVAPKGVYVVEGAHADPARGWPDAVSVSAVAAAQQQPILLVTHGQLPDETVDAIAAADAEEVTVVGGAAAVSEGVAGALDEVVDDVERLAGANRFETSRAVAERGLDSGLGVAEAWFVSGGNWPDALVGGPAAAAEQASVLLAHPSTLEDAPAAKGWVLQWRGPLGHARLVGGTAALSETVEDELRDLLAGTHLDSPELDIDESNTDVFSGTVNFGPTRMWPIEASGEEYTEVEVPGIESGSEAPGQPAVPTYRFLIGVPRGAEVDIDATATVDETHDVTVLPAQPQPADQAPDTEPPAQETFENKPFEKDVETYSSGQRYPAEDGYVQIIGRSRDLTIAQVELPAGSFTGGNDSYAANSEVSFTVSFSGGNDTFVTERTFQHTDLITSILIPTLQNDSSITFEIPEPDPEPDEWPCQGEDLLVFTDPTLRPAAEDLAAWKNEGGLLTTVIDAGEGTDLPGVEHIADEIEYRYEHCLFRPSYILLLGATDRVPTGYVEGSLWSPPDDDDDLPVYSEFIGSDYRYANLQQVDDLPGDDPDLLPDFAVGRIPAGTLADAQTAVDKIITYESSPPDDGGFYDTATIAAQFQCCRWGTDQDGVAQRTFTEVGEFLRDALMAAGHTGERIYEDSLYDSDDNYVDDDGEPRDPTPRRYYDGTPLPADLAPGSGFAWDGGTQDILDAVNDGRFLMVHRDHGWPAGWAHPQFHTGHVSSLTNGDHLPVVWSVNCASGIFDHPTIDDDDQDRFNDPSTSFAEEMLFHPDGGAVGLLGDTRNSPSWPNTALTRGFADAVFPDAVDDFGGDQGLRRLGDILNHGKLYLSTQIGVSGAGVTEARTFDSLHLWHVIGDPSQAMWTSEPTQLPLDTGRAYGEQTIVVDYPVEGATITAWQGGEGEQRGLGRAVVENGEAEIHLQEHPLQRVPIQLSASKRDHVPRQLEPIPAHVAP